MTMHTKSRRRAARRCYAERCVYPLLRLEADAAISPRITLSPDAWRRLCELAGLDADTGLPTQDGAP